MSSPAAEHAHGPSAAVAGARVLADRLDGLVLQARTLALALMSGAHGRRREGQGDSYWQHREMRDGESLTQVDWRGSARSDRLYVREHEQETPARLQVWCDRRPSMDWRGGEDRPTKADAGLVIGLGLALAARDGGEAVAVLGAPPTMRVADLARGLLEAGSRLPSGARPGTVLLVSDGLEEPDIWHHRIRSLRQARASVAVLLLADPAETSFPYRGRLDVEAPGGATRVRIGRAEAASGAYGAVWAGHMDAVVAASRDAGATVVRHLTSQSPVPAAFTLAQQIGLAGHGRAGA